jgi:hypothetical protein
MIPKTPEEEAQYAREALAKYSPKYGTPAQIAAVTLALDAGVKVLCVDYMDLSFLVFRPVPPNVEEALNALIPVPPPRSWLDPGEARYVTTNPNWQRTPYWDLDFEATGVIQP